MNDQHFNEHDDAESENIEANNGMSLSKYTWYGKENSQCHSQEKKQEAKNVDYEYLDHETPKNVNSLKDKLKTVLTNKNTI